MKAVRVFSVGILVLAAAACTTEVPAPLTAAERTTYKIEKVVVTVPDEAEVWWGAGDRAVARSAGVETSDAESTETYIETPEGRGALHSLAAQRIERSVAPQVAFALVGQKPVQLSMVVDQIFVASSAQQVLIGGNHLLWAGVQVFDLETGEAVTDPQRLFAFGGGGGGILGAAIDAARAAPIDRLGSEMGIQTRNWLLATGSFEVPFAESQNKLPFPIPGPEVTPPAAPEAVPSS